MSTSDLATHFRRAYGILITYASYLQSPLLLLTRLYWGYSFFVTGKAKLSDHEAFVQHFTEWHIPFPSLNVWLAGTTECVGGLFLLAGLASRLTAIPLAFTMLVAYVSAEPEKFKVFFSDPDTFTSATPFPFLFAVLLILAFGPGFFSLDRLIAHLTRKAFPASSAKGW